MERLLTIFAREAADPNGTTEFLLANDLPYLSFSLDKGPTTPMMGCLVAIGALYCVASSPENKRSLVLSGASIALLLLFQCVVPTYISNKMAFLAVIGFFALGLAPIFGAWVAVETGWYFVTAGATLLVASMLLNMVDLSRLQQLESDLFEVLRLAGMPG